MFCSHYGECICSGKYYLSNVNKNTPDDGHNMFFFISSDYTDILRFLSIQASNSDFPS